MGWFFVFASLVVGVAAQIITKAGVEKSGILILGKESVFHQVIGMITTPVLLLGGFLYALSFYFYLNALTALDFSKAAPAMSVSYVMVVLAGQFLFHENVTAIRWAGVVLVILGVFFISRS